MKISACYIVKNEEKKLAKSLASLCKSADEIIVVDTGSADRTKDIAVSFGAKVYDFVWQDDFSGPRNFALSKAQGDWIIFLDADEYFTQDSSQRLRSYIKSRHKSGVRGILLIHRYDVDEDNDDELLTDILVPRIFYHNPHYAYVGIIHEELLEDGHPLEDIHIVPADKLRIVHTGYSAGVSLDKARRNLKMLLQELEITDHPERLYTFLADAYLGLDDKENARYYAELDVSQGRRPVTYASRAYRILLQLSLERGESAKERLPLCEASVRDFPESPEFRADLAECLAAAGDYKRAVAEMKQAVSAYHNYHSIEPMLMTESQINLAQARMEEWQKYLQPVSSQELTVVLWMLVLVCLHLRREQYKTYAGRDVLPAGYRLVIDRYHGLGGILDDTITDEYLRILDKLLERNEEACLEKIIALVPEFSESTREKIIARLDKKIHERERLEAGV